jgi:hypothetical protein
MDATITMAIDRGSLVPDKLSIPTTKINPINPTTIPKILLNSQTE